MKKVSFKKNDIVTVGGGGGWLGFWGTLRIVAVLTPDDSMDGYDVVDNIANGSEPVYVGEYTFSDESGEFNEGDRVAFGASSLSFFTII